MKARGICTAACALLLFSGAAYAADTTDPENTGKHAADATDPDDAGRHADDATDPENTGKNVRDRAGDNPTVFDQGGSEADRNITAKIRQALVDNDALSTNAHNVKIITIDGVVTLRGPVDSAAEKTAVESAAKTVAGVKNVNSQLEVDAD